MSDKSEWIEWHGGECPVDPVNTEIQVVYGSGEVGNTNMPGILTWRHSGLSESYKIKRYRLINEGEMPDKNNCYSCKFSPESVVDVSFECKQGRSGSIISKYGWDITCNSWQQKPKTKDSKMPNKTELKKELDELSAKMDAIIERMAEINEELKKKTYPVGYDPEGKYLTTLDNEGKFIVSKFEDIIVVDRPLFSKIGDSFTTREQAQNRADGRNALHELIQVIHEENEKIDGNKNSEFSYRDDTVKFWLMASSNFHYPEALRMKTYVPSVVINRLGHQKIITALKYGLA